ncbi:30S ribosomal protein S19e [Sulfolobales archaeon HS-7]|nr:30S ribosomal protein S19e [Sulfolobales archaeon HS-7]
MVTMRQLPPDKVIEKLAYYIKESIQEISPPQWVYFSKTASFKERVPDDVRDWWYVRAASILRHVYIYGAVSVGDTKMIYGSRKRRGTLPPEFRTAPGHANRMIMQQLEKAGLVFRTKKGRRLTSKGRSLLDNIAIQVFDEISKYNPELVKYR